MTPIAIITRVACRPKNRGIRPLALAVRDATISSIESRARRPAPLIPQVELRDIHELLRDPHKGLATSRILENNADALPRILRNSSVEAP